MERFQELGGDLGQVRRRSIRTTADGRSSQVFDIELSKHEFIGESELIEVEGISVRSYSLAMIGVEKLRALCQQMESYPRKHRTPRHRDLYDLHAIATDGAVNFASAANVALLRESFRAKDVPLHLLGKLHEEHHFHQQGWPAVTDTIPPSRVSDYDYYFDFALELIGRLEALGVIDSP